MIVTKIVINNYRLLKNMELDLEKDLSLIIGKNNCGKTSVISALNKFIGSQSGSNIFTFDDFNLDFKNKLFEFVDRDGVDWNEVLPKGIELYLYIKYDSLDNLANIRPLMLDLDPNNNIVILKFEYMLSFDKMESLIKAFSKYYSRFDSDSKVNIDKTTCFDNFIKMKHRQFFEINKKAVLYDLVTCQANETEFRYLSAKTIDLNKVISFRYISAHRDTVNKDNDATLSNLSTRYYEKTKTDDENPDIQHFEDTLIDTDRSLTNVYHGIFNSVIQKVKKFGGIRENETVVNIISTLSQQQLLKENTTVVYDTCNHQLPESYNGLGYLNLISIIFEIETILSEFRYDRDDSVAPANINLLFIEEPEAHTHPQMQYIFIKNIKQLLLSGCSGEEGKKNINLQAVITTHSSHIVSECDFDDIKYFRKSSGNSVESKNLKELKIKYKDEKDPDNNHFKFLKQYLTLNCSEIFFADKVILYEGDTERILLPAIMRKIDQEETSSDAVPLLSQNISLIEAGAYSQIFEKFLIFIGIKTLIITDIDSGIEETKPDKNGVSRTNVCSSTVENGTHTSNSALKHYYSVPLAKHTEKQLNFFKELTKEEKVLANIEDSWYQDVTGLLMLVYQTLESEDDNSYYPRSFEDAFFHINRQFIINNIYKFVSLQKRDMFSQMNPAGTDYKNNSFDLAEKCIKSKSSFPMDILLNSKAENGSDFSNWQIPPYIKEGLLWLRDDLKMK